MTQKNTQILQRASYDIYLCHNQEIFLNYRLK